jgi:ABC-type multidrug transport system fused ATPase/permease subunit
MLTGGYPPLALFGVIADLIITLSASPYAAILFPFILALLYGLQLFYLRTSRQARLLDLEAKTPLYTHFTETSDGLQHIRAFGWEDQVLTKGEELLDHSQKPFYFMYCIQRWLSLVLDLTVAGIAIVLVAVALNVRSTKQPALGLALLYAMKLGPQFTYLMDEWVDLETSLGALFRLRAFGEDTPVEETLGTSHGQGPRRQMVQVPETWPEYGDIDLNGVSSYYSTASGRNRQALRDVSVAIHAGTKNAIVGRTGSGKSSLFLTLLNFLEYTGSIIIDGIEVSTVPRSVLRSRIISISQDLIHLPSSVRDNLTPHDMNKSAEERLPEASIFDALAKVGLDDYIRTCGGLDVPLDEVNLSQGQRQLLALARALIQMGRTRSTVILVDEATSSVDIECEKKMQDVMDGAFEGCTVLTIAHRMHTMNAAHCMLEMSHGRLVGEES